MRYVALLRAINVGGHTVKMDRLRAIFEAIPFEEVQTFIASGNVIFNSTRSAASLEKQIEKILAQSLGYDVATFIRTPAQLATAAAIPEPAGVTYIGFLHSKPTPAASKALLALKTDIDTFKVAGTAFYWFCKTGMGTSRITGARIEKTLGMPATLRNITTVRNLAEKYSLPTAS